MPSSPDPSNADSHLLQSVGAVFDHAAHAVPSIREVLPLYRDVLGGRVSGGGFNPWGGHLAVHFEFSGGGRVEVLEAVDPESPAVASFLRRLPRGGLHHLTFKVASLSRSIEAAESCGYRVFGTRVESDDWKETYIHPRSSLGALIQLAESRPGLPPPLRAPIEDILDEADARREAFARRAAASG